MTSEAHCIDFRKKWFYQIPPNLVQIIIWNLENLNFLHFPGVYVIQGRISETLILYKEWFTYGAPKLRGQMPINENFWLTRQIWVSFSAYKVRDNNTDKFRNSVLEIHINKAILFCLDIIILILIFRLITIMLSQLPINQGIIKYRTRANKGRGLYSKNIFWPMIAANNRERLLIKNYFLPRPM